MRLEGLLVYLLIFWEKLLPSKAVVSLPFPSIYSWSGPYPICRWRCPDQHKLGER